MTHMEKPKFSMTFNLGHLLQIATLIIAMTVGWMEMDARTSDNAARVSAIEKEAASLRPRLRVLENTSARSEARFDSILGYLSRIESRLERMEGK